MTAMLPTYYISHGGGPWPWVPQMKTIFASLEVALKQMVVDHGEKPKAILMISGHWEDDSVAIMASPKPPMLYDYYGFPPETYEVVYGAPGAPDFALRTQELLNQAGIHTRMDTERGFDHGTFVSMAVMYPEADVPLYQISMLKSFNPEDHMAIGRALAPLRKEGVMIVGSGSSFHNLQMPQGQGQRPSAEFDDWLYEAMMAGPDERKEAMNNWAMAPGARICHPREDHFVPLFIALGAAENERATRIYNDVIPFGSLSISNYRFG